MVSTFYPKMSAPPLRKYVKKSIKLFIESDGNLVTLVIRSSKQGIFHILDRILPDDDEEPVKK